MRSFKNIDKAAIALAAASLSILASGCGGSPSAPPIVAASAAATSGVVAGGCLPITGPIPFSAAGVYLDSMTIKLGQIPYGVDPLRGINSYDLIIGGNPVYLPQYGYSFQNFGSASIGGAAVTGAYNTTNNTPHPATLSLNVTNVVNRTDFIGVSTGNVQGTIVLAPATQQSLLANVSNSAYFNPYGGAAQPLAATTCVVQVAISMSVSSSGIPAMGIPANTLYNGRIYLYLRNPTGIFSKLYLPI